jgi:hypothetical protein
MPIYSLNSAMQMIVHNQYDERFLRLKMSGHRALSSSPKQTRTIAYQCSGRSPRLKLRISRQKLLGCVSTALYFGVTL